MAKVAPAPWTLTGVGYSFLLLSTPFSPSPLPLPEASYAPLEKGSSGDLTEGGGSFHGGVGVVMLIRYESSDVGPYDELIYMPGVFKVPSVAELTKDEFHKSITRIYVSTKESAENGRRNWGIPKHLASFDFTSVGRSTLITVSTPSSPTSSTPPKPFFSAFITPSFLPSLPISTSLFSAPIIRSLLKGWEASLIQPPLPASSSPSAAEETSSEGYRVVKPDSSGWAKGCYIKKGEGGEEEFGDGVGFPKFKVKGGMGVELRFRMTFPVAEVL
ncbi:acetoacetate decarboxylase beta barrel domain containing protein [Pseudohyphozyma bogoriensis]|nr:acetoacetate decarboxylase beta barrel domain containing protein [Pseudohyphozyma bogoriensis]